MAQTLMREVKVEELTKFGFKSEGKYVNWSKNINESDKGKVVPGGVYSCELYVADSGKEYVNKVLAQNGQKTMAAIVKTVPAVVDVARAKRYTPPPVSEAVVAERVKKALSEEPMGRKDWEAKDRRISRQGLIQACLIALAPVMTVDNLFSAAEQLATQALEFVNRV